MPSLDKRDNVQIKEMVLSDMPTVVSESSDSIEKPMATQGHVETVNYDFQSGLEVRFEPNSEEPLESSKVEIKAFSDYIQSRPDTKMQITGYTDNSGNKDQNLKISEQRAKKVKSLLVSYGISADRMTAIGKGDWNPISSNETQEGRIANRRVEIEIK
jgi:outer membrane protein OmpA-like peptidoglycan-associated protein